jgi:two-component system, chemotaxis family, response regulator Rcp1
MAVLSTQRNTTPHDLLYVEDNPGDVALFSYFLKKMPVTVSLTVVEDGEQAIEFLHKRGAYSNAPRLDIILLDLNLPKKDGRIVLHEIKAEPSLRLIPTIVFTTSGAKTDVVTTYCEGASSFIRKPYDIGEWDTIIRQITGFWLSLAELPPKEAVC